MTNLYNTISDKLAPFVTYMRHNVAHYFINFCMFYIISSDKTDQHISDENCSSSVRKKTKFGDNCGNKLCGRNSSANKNTGTFRTDM